MDSKRFLSTMLIMSAIMLGYWFFFVRNKGSSAVAVPYAIYNNLPTKPLGLEKGADGKDPIPDELNHGPQLGGFDDKNDTLLAVRLNNVTAGIDSVQLNKKQYAADYKKTAPLTLFTADPALGKPFSTAGIHIQLVKDGPEIPYGMIKGPEGGLRPAEAGDSAEAIAASNAINMLSTRYVWQLDEGQTATDASFHATFLGLDGKPVARITKHFHLDPKSYELTITHSVQNLTPATIYVRIDQLTAPTLARDDPQTDDRFFHGAALNTSSKPVVDDKAGYNMVWGGLRKAAESSTIPTELGTTRVGQMSEFGTSPILWVASSNRFFGIVVRPLPETGNAAKTTLNGGGEIPQPTHIATADIDLMKVENDKPEADVAMVRMTGKVLEIETGKAMEEGLSVYMGPKDRSILLGEDATLPGNVTIQGDKALGTYGYIKLVQFNTCMLYSFCVFDQVAYGILATLDFFKSHIAFGNYGIAIMILVLVVRAILHPLTRASQVNMAKMGKQMRDVAPQMDAVKKRYADNKKKQSEEMMRIYRENKINPAGGIMGCLPMLIQMPIWAALYSGLRSDIDLRHAAFIPGWINDLASPDKLLPPGVLSLGNPLFHLPLLGDIYGLNLLPILLAGVFYFQMKVTKATQPPPADEQQAQMAKMSGYMIFLFPLMLYNAPSGLNLYIFASTMGGLLDTYLVRKTLKKKGILASNAPLLPMSDKPVEDKPIE